MPDHTSQRAVRTQYYWDLCDFATGRGLELGPLFNPIVGKHEADVTYVDVFSTQQLLTNYEGDPNVDVSDIVPVDVSLGRPDGGVVSLPEALNEHEPFDWVMASHVIEHVPDFLGWLKQVAEVTADNGALVLAIPDKRYTFDIHRPLTTTGQIVAAHDAQTTRPDSRAVYDHTSTTVTVDLAALWAGVDPPDFTHRMYTDAQVAELLDRAREGAYLDTHVWVLTPQSFLEHVHDLRRLGTLPWRVEELIETGPGEHEFRVRLRRIPRGEDVTRIADDELVPEGDIPHWQHEANELRRDRRELHEARGRLRELDQLRAQNAKLRGKLDQTRAKKRRTAARLVKARSEQRRLRRRLKATQRTLETIRGSRQWRVGGKVIGPLRAARRLIRR